MTDAVLLLNTRPLAELMATGGQDLLDRGLAVHLVTHRFDLDGLEKHAFAGVQVVDLRDEECVAQTARWLIREHSISRIVAPAEKFLSLAALLRDEFGLAGIDHPTAERFRDKVLMKSVVADAGITVPRYAEATDTSAVQGLLDETGPVVLKNRRGWGGNQVTIVDCPARIPELVGRLGGVADDYEVEEFVSGEMYHCDAVVTGGNVVFATVSRYLSRPGDFRTNPYGGSVLIRDGAIRTSVLAANATVVGALGLADGVTHLELFRRHEDLVFCEIAARPGGGWIDRYVLAAYGVDLFTTAVRLDAGLPVGPFPAADVVPPDEWACVGFYPRPGTVSAISQDPGDRPGVVTSATRASAGQVLTAPRHCTDYVSKHLLTAPTSGSLHALIDSLDSGLLFVADK